MQEHPETGGDVQPAERGVGAEPDTVKVYASDSGHPAQAARGAGSGAGALETMCAHCRERIVARPWTALCTAAVLGSVIGTLAGYCCGRRHDPRA